MNAANVANVPWPIARVQADIVWPSTRGANVKVAVLDTGIDSRWGELTVLDGCNAVNDPEVIGCVEGGWADINGHGTMVASLIAANPIGGHITLTGVAPEADLYAVRVCNNSGSCAYADILEGLAWAATSGMDVVNMSFGTTDPSGADMCEAMAAMAGIVLVAASGNTVDMSYPAACPNVIGVGAVDPDDGLYSGSGRGQELAGHGLVAPGQQVFLLHVFPTVAVSTGTSFASPIVAGAAALLLAGGRDAADVYNILAASAVDLGMPAEHQGAGLLDIYAAWTASAPGP